MGVKKGNVLRMKKKHLYIGIILLVLFLILFSYTTIRNGSSGAETGAKVVRQPAIAGSWYPGTESSLRSTVEGYLENAKQISVGGRVVALIEPHAGYRFSGQAAAHGFNQLEKDYDTVILIGPSHYVTFRGASIPNVTHYRTPLGDVKVSSKARQLLKEKMFSTVDEAHEREHSLEIEIPFIQEVLGDVEIVPIVIGSSTNYDDAVKLGESIKKHVDDKTLIVVSSDFTHYGPNYGYMPFSENEAENIRNLDEGALQHIVKLDSKGFYDYVQQTGITICGYLPVTILLSMLEDVNVRPLVYDTSGRQMGDYTNSVSYVTVAFSKEEGVGKEDQELLLKLARQTLESYVTEGKVPAVNEDLISDSLVEEKGCFVTLEIEHNLRGCIGDIIPQQPLYKCVIENAVNAAVNDRRFNKVQEEEFDEIEIEISVLSVPEEVEFTSADELLDKLTPMEDGVIIRSGLRQSTYLPQVWDNFPSKENFLSSLCEKGGASRDCWKDTSTSVLTYQAQVFREE